MKKLILIGLFMTLFLPAKAGAGSLPKCIGYQGKLTNSSGQPLSGSYNFTFRLYNYDFDTVNATWTETQNGIEVTNGLYTVMLGTKTAGGINLLFDGNYWLEITVGGDTLAPRQMLAASPYAIRSEYANNVATATYAVNAATAVYVLNPGAIDRANNLSGGAKYSIPYQSGPNATTFLNPGSDGYLLVTHGGGSTPPGWLDPASLSIGSISGVISSTQIAAGSLPGNVVVSSITSANYLNDIRVSSAIFANNALGALNAGSIFGTIRSSQIAAGVLGPNVVVSSITSANYLNDIRVSSAIYANSAGGALNAGSIYGLIQSSQIAGGVPNAGSIYGMIRSSQIAAGALGPNVVVSSITSANYLNDVRVSSAIYADNAGIVANAGSIYGIIQSSQIAAGVLGPNVVISSITSANYLNNVKVSSAIYADNAGVVANAGSIYGVIQSSQIAGGVANAGSIYGIIQSSQIAAGVLGPSVVVSSITSANYLNDVRVSSAIYADNAGIVANAGSIYGIIQSSQIAAGVLGPNVVVSSITSANYLNDVKVSSAVYADNAGIAANAGSIYGVIQSSQIAAGKLPDDVYVSSVAVNSVTDSAITGISGSKISGSSSISVSSITASGYIQMSVKTAAELQVIEPSGTGQLYYNSTTNRVFVSTGTAAGSFAEIGNYSTGP